jgi:hypothetical protein
VATPEAIRGAGSTPEASPPGPADRLDLEPDALFQSRSWRIQRLGWLLTLLICVAGLIPWRPDSPGPAAVDAPRGS